jgi:hypothetical protein
VPVWPNASSARVTLTLGRMNRNDRQRVLQTGTRCRKMRLCPHRLLGHEGERRGLQKTVDGGLGQGQSPRLHI